MVQRALGALDENLNLEERQNAQMNLQKICYSLYKYHRNSSKNLINYLKVKKKVTKLKLCRFGIAFLWHFFWELLRNPSVQSGPV